MIYTHLNAIKTSLFSFYLFFTPGATHGHQKTDVEKVQEKARDDRTKVGEEEGGSPDPLSLTLLTDIWQTINQDNGSKTPSQKPPAAAPPPPSQQLAPQKNINPLPPQPSALRHIQMSLTPHQRYVPSLRPLYPGPNGGSLRHRPRSHMMHSLRRQDPFRNPTALASLQRPLNPQMRTPLSFRPTA